MTNEERIAALEARVEGQAAVISLLRCEISSLESELHTLAVTKADQANLGGLRCQGSIKEGEGQ